MASKEKFIEIINKYNMPIPVNEIANKVVDYIVDNYDTHIIVFKDNTCYFLWTETDSCHIVLEWDLDSVSRLYSEDYMLSFQSKYQEAYNEWAEEKKALWQRQQDKLEYDRYLKLKEKFENQ
jgi:hypothetical protein